MPNCFDCHRDLERMKFAKSQLKKAAAKRRCLDCVASTTGMLKNKEDCVNKLPRHNGYNKHYSIDDTASTVSSNSAMSLEDDWKVFDPKELGCGGTYQLGISAVAPRPIAVITSKSKDNVLNCAPYS